MEFFVPESYILYDEQTLQAVFDELRRVLKPDRPLIIDFLTDRKRTKPDGSLVWGYNEIHYDLQTGQTVLPRLFKKGFSSVSVQHTLVNQDLTHTVGYVITGKKLVAYGYKK